MGKTNKFSIPQIVDNVPENHLWLSVLLLAIEDAISNAHLPASEDARKALTNRKNVALLVEYAALPSEWVDKILDFSATMDACGWVYDRPDIDAGNLNGQLTKLEQFSARAPKHHEQYRRHQAEKAEKARQKREDKLQWHSAKAAEREARDAAWETAIKKRNEELRSM